MLKLGFCLFFSRIQFPIAKKSISVAIKHLKASSGVFTIGSPRTLKDVFTRTGHFVTSLNLVSK